MLLPFLGTGGLTVKRKKTDRKNVRAVVVDAYAVCVREEKRIHLTQPNAVRCCTANVTGAAVAGSRFIYNCFFSSSPHYWLLLCEAGASWYAVMYLTEQKCIFFVFEGYREDKLSKKRHEVRGNLL